MAIHLLNDHKPKQPTRDDRDRKRIVEVVEFYMGQMPAFIGQTLEAALGAYDAGRRDEFAAWVASQEDASESDRALLTRMLTVFGPRKPMPVQPEQDS